MSKRAELVRKTEKDKIGITYNEFLDSIEQNPCLHWYEDMDEYYRNRQLKRKTPAIKKSFVFNYKGPENGPELHGTFIHDNKVWIDIKWETEEGKVILSNLAKSLDAKLSFQ